MKTALPSPQAISVDSGIAVWRWLKANVITYNQRQQIGNTFISAHKHTVQYGLCTLTVKQ